MDLLTVLRQLSLAQNSACILQQQHLWCAGHALTIGVGTLAADNVNSRNLEVEINPRQAGCHECKTNNLLFSCTRETSH